MIESGIIKHITERGKIKWQKHALQRMFERNITRDRVKKALIEGEIITYYEHDKPFPSVLIMHKNQDIIHVVASFDIENEICYIITVYYPDSKYFEDDMMTRRRQ